jgi:hypothetical protein
MANLRGQFSSLVTGLLEPITSRLPGRRVLARSRRFTLLANFDSAVLVGPDGRRSTVAELYGEPAAALIDEDERWVLVAGCGLVFKRLDVGGDPIEMLARPGDTWWVEALYQAGPDSVRFVVDPDGRHAGVWELDLSDLSVRALVAAPEVTAPPLPGLDPSRGADPRNA